MIKPCARKVLDNGATEVEQYDVYRGIREKFSDDIGGEECSGGLRRDSIDVSARESIGDDVNDRWSDAVRNSGEARGNAGADARNDRTRNGEIIQNCKANQRRAGKDEGDAVTTMGDAPIV